jgi:hypothetical protein
MLSLFLYLKVARWVMAVWLANAFLSHFGLLIASVGPQVSRQAPTFPNYLTLLFALFYGWLAFEMAFGKSVRAFLSMQIPKKPNHSTEPTPTPGTSAAEHPPRQP